MNPLLKFIVKRLEGKLDDLQQFTDQVDNFDSFQNIVGDMEVYFEELKQIVGDVVL